MTGEGDSVPAEQGLPASRVILLVDDEVLIRMPVAEYLRECGYTVIEAADADEALTVLKAADRSIDLVFTDVTMPGSMDGFSLARWVRENRPGVAVLITSGAAGAARQAAAVCDEQELVPKPYHHPNLLDRIKQLLARAER
jgi:CheY-like chemotaxis protein